MPTCDTRLASAFIIQKICATICLHDSELFDSSALSVVSSNPFSPLSPDPTDIGPPLGSSSPTTGTTSGTTQRQRKKKMQQFDITSLNCNSLKSTKKQAEFSSLIDLHNPAVILGCESKIDREIASYDAFPEDFEVFRKDRTKSGGGVFTAVRNDIIANHESTLDKKN